MDSDVGDLVDTRSPAIAVAESFQTEVLRLVHEALAARVTAGILFRSSIHIVRAAGGASVGEVTLP
jgi:hypothetical protein